MFETYAIKLKNIPRKYRNLKMYEIAIERDEIYIDDIPEEFRTYIVFIKLLLRDIKFLLKILQESSQLQNFFKLIFICKISNVEKRL